jgi:uncharacterized protein (TIGR00645 family)
MSTNVRVQVQGGDPVVTPARSRLSRNRVERATERAMFASRWLLAPVYAVLSVGLVVLLVKFAQSTVDLVSHILVISATETIVGILGLIDLALIGSLLLIVIFVSYERFVSRLDSGESGDEPHWMTQIDFTGLKLKVMAALVAISAIRLLEDFFDLRNIDDRHLAWSVGIHVTFVVSGLLLALVDRVSRKRS